MKSEEKSELQNRQLNRDIERRFEIEGDKIVDVEEEKEKHDKGRSMTIMVSVTLAFVTLAGLIYSLINAFK